MSLMGPSTAALLPVVGGYYIQTNGATSAIGLGDYYTSTSGGAQDHRLSILIPCSWPAGRPVHIDLFGAEVTSHAAVQGLSEEPAGALDLSRFTVNGPDSVTATTTYPPTSVPEVWNRFFTIADGRAQCGEWVLTNSLALAANPATGGDDQNGWRLRVGGDDDTDPTNAPPADADDPDGIPGTDDEIALGLERTTFQHDQAGTICQTFWSFVSPDQPTATFHNFDMDSSGRVRYYAPGTTIDPSANTGGIVGTRSANARWNGSSGVTRVGDTITDPEPGWWAVVSCINTHNQLIQEGVNSGLLFMRQPATPRLEVAKDDGTTRIEAGGTTEYTITVDNVSDADASPGAARAVVITDDLPSPLEFASCSVVAPATGTCTHDAGTVTANLEGALSAGASAQIRIAVSVPESATTQTIVNTASVTYQDSYGNSFVPIEASDTDDVVRPSDVTVSISLEETFYAGQPNALSIQATNLGVEDASDVTVTGDLPAGFVVSGYDVPVQWSCTDDTLTYTCIRTGDLASGATESLRVLGTAPTAPGTDAAFPVQITTSTLETDTSNNDDEVVATTDAYPADVTVTITPESPSMSTDTSGAFVVTVGSEGLDDAEGVEVEGPLPTGFTITSFDAPGSWSCSVGATTWSCSRTGALPTGSEETLRLVGQVVADAGSAISADANVSTTTIELDLSDNNDTASLVARGLSLTADAECVLDVPWLSLDVEALGFTPNADDTATVVWRTLTGDIVHTDTDVPLDSARLLWPGAALDGDGRGTAWPGWTQVDGAWIEVADERDGTLLVEVSVNPTTTTTATYPEATAECAARPAVSPLGEGGEGEESTGGSGDDSPTERPESETDPELAAEEAPDADVAGAAGGTLPRTGSDLLLAVMLGGAFLIVGSAMARTTVRRPSRRL
jgi:uncharacterized repeat protein (TIGR01451 family)